MRTITEIIKAAGGPRAISDASADGISKDAVYKWPSIGIPDRHWALLIEMAGASPDELFAANRTAREPTAEDAA